MENNPNKLTIVGFTMALASVIAITGLVIIGLDKVKTFNATLAGHESKIANVNQSLNSKTEKINKDLDDVRSDISDSIAGVKTQIAQTNSNFKESVDELKDKIEICESEFVDTQNGIKDLRSAISQMEKSVNDVAAGNKAEREKMKIELGGLYSDLYNLQCTLANLEKKIQDYKTAYIRSVENSNDAGSIEDLFSNQIGASKPRAKN